MPSNFSLLEAIANHYYQIPITPIARLGAPMSALTEIELAEIERANQQDKQPVIFIHGLWLLPSSWAHWQSYFEANGFFTLAARWPGDTESVADARKSPQAFAGHSVPVITERISTYISLLNKKPILIGHSFGGLIAQKLAGQGLSICTIAIDPAPFKGVLPLPASVLKAFAPILLKPSNNRRAVSLTESQFRFGFGNAISEEESRALFNEYAVPTPAKPLFEGAFANFNPRAGTRVDLSNPNRGPLLIVSGEFDHVVPRAMTTAAFKLQGRNENKTEFVEIPGRGHSLVIDHGWKEVAEQSLKFIRENLEA